MNYKNKNGFTLIEMLTVMVIIGLLLSLLFPALQKTRNRARLLKARGEVRELTKAWDAYWYTYKSWPSGGGGISMSPKNVGILQGNNDNKILFMTFPPSAESGDGFLDPWGNVYQVNLIRPSSKTAVWAYSTKVYLNNRNRQN